MKKEETATINVRECNGGREIFDIVRKRFVALTPEEWVRQQVIHRMHGELGYPLELLQVEGTITLNGLTKRCDIVAYDKQVRPAVIVECKRETVPLTQKVLDQACRYNLVLDVPYLFLTNGPQQFCCKVDSATKQLIQLPDLPEWVKVC